MTIKEYKTLSVASHEIMNKLSFIGSAYQYISAKYPDSQDFKFWDIIGDSINELDILMQRTSICRHCAFPNISRNSLKQILSQLETYEGTCLNTSPQPVHIEYHCDQDVPINVDAKQLTIALCEIVMNGAEACNYGTIHIDTSIQQNHVNIIISNPGHLPEISLPKTLHEDSNISYAPDNIDILAEAFYTTKPNHYGLGLYIAQSVISKHCGTLKISQDNENSYVHIQLNIAL